MPLKLELDLDEEPLPCVTVGRRLILASAQVSTMHSSATFAFQSTRSDGKVTVSSTRPSHTV